MAFCVRVAREIVYRHAAFLALWPQQHKWLAAASWVAMLARSSSRQLFMFYFPPPPCSKRRSKEKEGVEGANLEEEEKVGWGGGGAGGGGGEGDWAEMKGQGRKVTFTCMILCSAMLFKSKRGWWLVSVPKKEGKVCACVCVCVCVCVRGWGWGAREAGGRVGEGGGGQGEERLRRGMTRGIVR